MNKKYINYGKKNNNNNGLLQPVTNLRFRCFHDHTQIPKCNHKWEYNLQMFSFGSILHYRWNYRPPTQRVSENKPLCPTCVCVCVYVEAKHNKTSINQHMDPHKCTKLNITGTQSTTYERHFSSCADIYDMIFVLKNQN